MTPQALVMLMLWPFVVAVFFSRMPRQQAIIWSLLAGYLVLPPLAAINLPVGPGLDKHLIPAMTASFFAFLKRDENDTDVAPPIVLPIALLLGTMLFVPYFTGFTNPDTLIDGVSVRPNIGFTQSMSESLLMGAHLLPFWLGYRYLSNPQGAKLLIHALVFAMLVYSVPMILEVRMSPQINVWVYGYFQHDFVQTMRYGGFRPIVFLEHPLWVAFLCLTALLCAIAITRTDLSRKWYAITGYLGMILIMCKSAGVLLHLIIAFPFLWLARSRMIVAVALALGTAVFFYPVVRAQPWMPLEEIIETVSNAEADRGQSLGFRLINETRLLARALERPYFGWGGWGRPLIIDPTDGRIETITDGEWIRVLGERGIVGYTAEFGLLLLPIFMLWRAWPRSGSRRPDQEEMAIAVLAMIMGLNMLDLIPNATLTPISWLMTGLIAGSAVRMRQGRYFTEDSGSETKSLPKKAGLIPVI